MDTRVSVGGSYLTLPSMDGICSTRSRRSKSSSSLYWKYLILYTFVLISTLCVSCIQSYPHSTSLHVFEDDVSGDHYSESFQRMEGSHAKHRYSNHSSHSHHHHNNHDDSHSSERSGHRVRRSVRPTKNYDFKESDGNLPGAIMFQLDKKHSQEVFKIESPNRWVTVDTNGAVKVKEIWDYEQLGKEKTIDFWVFVTGPNLNGRF